MGKPSILCPFCLSPGCTSVNSPPGETDRFRWRVRHFLVEHDLFAKPVSTFADHALSSRNLADDPRDQRIDAVGRLQGRKRHGSVRFCRACDPAQHVFFRILAIRRATT